VGGIIVFYDVYISLCKRSNKKPSVVATELGINKSNVSNWKNNGYTPRGDALQKIADYFGVTTDYLLTGEDTKKASTQEDERTISDKELMFALWGDSQNVDESDLEDVRRYAAFVEERKKKK
jgi:transcriptional regulator with XRE-family HTH domain